MFPNPQMMRPLRGCVGVAYRETPRLLLGSGSDAFQGVYQMGEV